MAIKKSASNPNESPNKLISKKVKLNPSKDLEFQILDWNSYHEVDDENVEQYNIQLFGRTADDKDVCLKVTDFTPYFYVEVPDNWKQKDADKFVDILKRKVSWISQNNPSYEYDISLSLVAHKLVRKHKFRNFSNEKLYTFIMLVFKSHNAMREISNILTRPLKATGLTREPMIYQRYEANIEPHIRFMHTNNLYACGWVKIDKNDLLINDDYSNCDRSFSVNWKKVVSNPDKNTTMAPFKIMGYDIECVSCDVNFPQSERKTDQIVQIGMTLFRYGSLECYEQHMLTLKKCRPIKGVHLECYNTEKGLIRGWAKKIREIRPDFMIGYNNFGFDDRYIYERIQRIDAENAEKQGIDVEQLQDKFMDEILMILGKVSNEHLVEHEGLTKSLTRFETNKLSSSALGDNELKFFKIPGIIQIDMMKVIQRDHRLIGYKLDDVSANFITEKITDVKTNPDSDQKLIVNIATASTKALEIGSYVQIMIRDSYASSSLRDGAKFKVLDIETMTETKIDANSKEEKQYKYQNIKVEMSIDDVTVLRQSLLNKKLDIYWTFAKDEMSFLDINKGFENNDENIIRKSAKYCLKDCKLPNLLCAKLEIVVNNISMANVCHVPLSYLFLRGQGVKILSLVSKKCREKSYLIPVLRKNKQDLDDTDETYEGATVITPKPGVYLSPIGVLDFSSLYPSSMCERNLSHETYVSDSIYDNLPGYVYHDIHIILKDKKGKILRNIDGSPQKRHNRFAQKIVTQKDVDAELDPIVKKLIDAKISNLEKINNETELTDAYRKDCNAYLKGKLNRTKDSDEKLEIENDIQYLKDAKKLDNKIRKWLGIILEETYKKQYDIEWKKKFNTVGDKTVRYGILPEILAELLGKRKETNNKLAEESDPFVRSILNSLQLAYKITANSLYGQTGAKTSPLVFFPIAESTTAIGRECLHKSKKIVEDNFQGAEIIYGDTDSIFINFHLKDENGNERTDESALKETIELCEKAAAIINKNMPRPQNIVYEKTFHPFILIAKKKYVGNLYTFDTKKFFQKCMGIVLKRRDNAPIVKIVVGGIIDNILDTRDIQGALKYTRETLTKLMNNEYSMGNFIISKTLKAKYKKPQTIAHKVLADRMGLRDPGNKPQINDRIPYAYIVTPLSKNPKVLQGDLIENPDYIIKHGLKIDYLYYLEHQIINPAAQIIELMMPARKVKSLFDEFIHNENNKRKGARSILDYAKPPKKSSKKINPTNTKATTKAVKKVSKPTKTVEKQTTKPVSKTKASIDKIKSFSQMDSFISVSAKRKHENKNMEIWFNEAQKSNDKIDVNDFDPECNMVISI